jgi:hypothetical protein
MLGREIGHRIGVLVDQNAGLEQDPIQHRKIPKTMLASGFLIGIWRSLKPFWENPCQFSSLELAAGLVIS